MIVLVTGTDAHGLSGELEALGATVHRADVGNRPALEEAGVIDADLFVLTEVEQATAIPVAKDLAPDLRVVVYADGSLPDFARGQADLVVDPDLLGPDAVAEELLETA